MRYEEIGIIIAIGRQKRGIVSVISFQGGREVERWDWRWGGVFVLFTSSLWWNTIKIEKEKHFENLKWIKQNKKAYVGKSICLYVTGYHVKQLKCFNYFYCEIQYIYRKFCKLKMQRLIILTKEIPFVQLSPKKEKDLHYHPWWHPLSPFLITVSSFLPKIINIYVLW